MLYYAIYRKIFYFFIETDFIIKIDIHFIYISLHIL